MSSYGSNHSGYLHPSQYPPNPPQQQQHQPQPPYPTTPGPAPGQQSAFYPPPTPQNQPMYSTSPASPWQQPNYSSSPTSAPQYPFYSSSPGSMPAQPLQYHRRSSSMSQSGRPQFTQFNSGTAPIAIPQQQQPYGWGSQQDYSAPRHGSHDSHHSHHHHHHHGHDGDEGDARGWGELDEDTLREYEKRYAKERKMERRPTLGESVISMVRALGGKRD